VRAREREGTQIEGHVFRIRDPDALWNASPEKFG
jgi:hypothetical protein